MSSASSQPPSYHLIGHGTVLSNLLPGNKLPKGRVYPLSIPECKAMEEYLQEALNQGFIWPSISPLASSFFVDKKDGGLWPCIDYRTLNYQMMKLPYPLPLVPAALEELRGARMFSKLVLRSAYSLVSIRESDEWKTAFITPTGHYDFLIMPYGLANAHSVFQEFMNEVSREFLHTFIIIYVDDILICSQNLADHRHHVMQVLLRLHQYHLYLKLEKREFHCPNVHFYRFIKDFSLHTAPLTSMLRGKSKSLSWNTNAHEAFEELKPAFSMAPILRHPDPHVPFVVEVDSSTTWVGAVLSQLSREPPRLQPYYSKSLSPYPARLLL